MLATNNSTSKFHLLDILCIIFKPVVDQKNYCPYIPPCGQSHFVLITNKNTEMTHVFRKQINTCSLICFVPICRHYFKQKEEQKKKQPREGRSQNRNAQPYCSQSVINGQVMIKLGLSQIWTAEWQLGPGRNRWSAWSRGSRNSRSFFPQCSARWGCIFCQTPWVADKRIHYVSWLNLLC